MSKKGAENNDSMQSQSKRTQVQGKGLASLTYSNKCSSESFSKSYSALPSIQYKKLNDATTLNELNDAFNKAC